MSAGRRTGALIAGAALAAAALLGAQPAPAQTRPDALDRGAAERARRDRDDDWGKWDDFNWTILQMQRESIASQEEQAREAGRARRREEIEKSQQKSAAEHEAYFESLLETSQAALAAPQGVFYRKPGFVTGEPPGSGARPAEAGGVAYLYDQGIFWLQRGAQYVVVTAPVGARVAQLPAGAARVAAKPGPLWYFFGAFFAEAGDAYEVVRPPAGTVVFYVPDGYTQEGAAGGVRYRFGETLFRPVFIQGVLAYQVTAP